MTFRDGDCTRPAFPITGEYIDGDGRRLPFTFGGMGLRDWFAGQALISITRETPQEMAKAAYMIADAMITERNK